MALSSDIREWVTLEMTCSGAFNGYRVRAEFLDDVYPDRTCGQYDAGILVGTSEREFFVSFTDGSVWDGDFKLEARCPEVCVMAAVRDAKQQIMYDYADDGTWYMVGC